MDAHRGGGRGVRSKEFGHKNATKYKKGTPLDFLTTPSTPLKTIWQIIQGPHPPGFLPIVYLWNRSWLIGHQASQIELKSWSKIKRKLFSLFLRMSLRNVLIRKKLYKTGFYFNKIIYLQISKKKFLLSNKIKEVVLLRIFFINFIDTGLAYFSVKKERLSDSNVYTPVNIQNKIFLNCYSL